MSGTSNDSGQQVLMPLQDAWSLVNEMMSKRKAEKEMLPLDKCGGRYCAEDVKALLDLPPFNRSAMDGYAVMKGDIRDRYDVIETISAGSWPARELKPGQAARIMTGAPTPVGTGQVIKIEDTDGGKEIVQVKIRDEKTNISPFGEDIRKGDPVIRAGTKLGSRHISALAATGNMEVKVHRSVRVAIGITGDELENSVEKLEPGRIMDVNGPMLKSLACSQGLEITRFMMIGDRVSELKKQINEASDNSDLLILTGGVSEGDYDYVVPVLKECGFGIHFSQLCIKPGKPTTFATRSDGVAAFGLPGNPVAVFLGFHLFVIPAVAMMSSANPFPLRCFNIRIADGIRIRNSERDSFRPCRINRDGLAEMISFHGSGHVMALCDADGFVRISKGVERVEAYSELPYYSCSS